MDVFLKDPVLLAKEKNISIELISGEEKEKVFDRIKSIYFNPNVLNKNISWGDRLLNSLVAFPSCSLNSYRYDTKKWLLEYIPQYCEKTLLLVSNSLSNIGSLYRFESGNIFSKVFYKTTLCTQRELFLTNNDLTYLICYTELDHLLAYGEVVNWIYNKAQQLGEDIAPILWNP